MILIISHEQDPHAMRVIQHLQTMGHTPILFDLGEFPNSATLSIEYAAGGQPNIDFVRATGEAIALNEVKSVWWRRPQLPDLSSVTDPEVHLFTANEWNEAINGLWQLLLDARWMNDPILDDAASRKARQLRVAAEVGLKTPRTLITSDPQRARQFAEHLGHWRVIYKTFSCTHAVWRETRRLHQEDFTHIDSVRVAPIIFQEFIPAECDLRITAVGEQLFAATIRSKPREDSIDFRMHVGDAELQTESLPEEIRDKLRALLNQLGLVYGAIDMRQTPEGEYYFLEVNTAGEFLFIEDRTGQSIARAIAEWLAGVKSS